MQTGFLFSFKGRNLSQITIIDHCLLEFGSPAEDSVMYHNKTFFFPYIHTYTFWLKLKADAFLTFFCLFFFFTQQESQLQSHKCKVGAEHTMKTNKSQMHVKHVNLMPRHTLVQRKCYPLPTQIHSTLALHILAMKHNQ